MIYEIILDFEILSIINKLIQYKRKKENYF